LIFLSEKVVINPSLCLFCPQIAKSLLGYPADNFKEMDRVSGIQPHGVIFTISTGLIRGKHDVFRTVTTVF
jgi:hypothetical protein